MAKDPRFNFYPDNWSGGTKRMNFEQKGAYMELLLVNFYCFSDGLPGFTEEEALKTLVHAAAYAELWCFLKPKFQTDGKYFWSERMQKEFYKAKKNSQKQSERAKERWNKKTAYAAALPVNGYGSGNGIGIELKGVQGENEKHIVPPEAIDLTDALCDFFNIRQITMSKIYDTVCDYVSTVTNRNELQIAAMALQKYMTYKARSQETKHSIYSWIGTKDNHYNDGQWLLIDWDAKNKNYKENGQRNNIKGSNGQNSPEPGKDYRSEGF